MARGPAQHHMEQGRQDAGQAALLLCCMQGTGMRLQGATCLCAAARGRADILCSAPLHVGWIAVGEGWAVDARTRLVLLLLPRRGPHGHGVTARQSLGHADRPPNQLPAPHPKTNPYARERRSNAARSRAARGRAHRRPVQNLSSARPPHAAARRSLGSGRAPRRPGRVP